MIRRALLALLMVAAVLFAVMPKASAATYYGTMPGIYTTSGWTGDNPYYYVMSSTGHAQPLKVYRISPGVFGFFNPTTGYTYTNSVGAGPCGPWLCDDAGAILDGGGNSGVYIVHCYPGRPGWFSLWSNQTKEWGVLTWLAGGYSMWFGYPKDPISLPFPNGGVFYSYIEGAPGAWCGA